MFSKTDIPHLEPQSEENQNRIGMAFLILASALMFSLLINFILLLTNRSLALKQKIYVEQPDGSSVIAQEFDRYYRSSKVIEETITEWINLTFEWDNKLPGTEKEKTDRGRSVGDEKKVTSKAYTASFLLLPGFRQEFLKGLGKIIPEEVFTGDAISNVIIHYISEPRTINANLGRYEVDVIATRTDIKPRGEQQTYLRKTFTLQAVEPKELNLEEPIALRKQLALLLRNGLMIAEISEFQSPIQFGR